MTRFKELINKIISFIEQQKNGFSVREKVVEINDTDHILYKDENQVLIYLNREF